MAATSLVDRLPALPIRAIDGHKGSYGRVLVVAGSRGMSGAAGLCGLGALRGGAGLVQVAAPAEVIPTVAACSPCYLTAPLAADADGRLSEAAGDAILDLAAISTVLALGPGLGQSPAVTLLVVRLLTEAPLPIILDADGLNAMAGEPRAGPLRNAEYPLIMTPHPGEFARLLGSTTGDVLHRREELACTYAADHHCVLVLKGHCSLVTDGRRLYRNGTGNPGMGTGGTGDVLTGLIAALVAQGLGAFEAAQLGVYLHGLAGDLAAERLGQVSLIATDLLDYLPAAILRHQAATSS